MEIASHPALTGVTPHRSTYRHPQATPASPRFVQRFSVTLYHPTSTYAIGSGVDKTLKSTASMASPTSSNEHARDPHRSSCGGLLKLDTALFTVGPVLLPDALNG
jgi:hypothetical protein